RLLGDIAAIEAARMFDRTWYLAKYPDIAEAGTDPLKHYFHTGWLEGRDPSNWFSTQYYLSANQDVAQSGVNPLWHYAVAGKKEGRLASHPAGAQAEMLSRLLPLAEQRRLQQDAQRAPKFEHLAEQPLYDLLREGVAEGRLLVAFCQDDYRQTLGGIQLCLQLEQRATRDDLGHSFLALHPQVWLP